MKHFIHVLVAAVFGFMMAFSHAETKNAVSGKESSVDGKPVTLETVYTMNNIQAMQIDEILRGYEWYSQASKVLEGVLSQNNLPVSLLSAALRYRVAEYLEFRDKLDTWHVVVMNPHSSDDPNNLFTRSSFMPDDAVRISTGFDLSDPHHHHMLLAALQTPEVQTLLKEVTTHWDILNGYASAKVTGKDSLALAFYECVYQDNSERCRFVRNMLTEQRREISHIDTFLSEAVN